MVLSNLNADPAVLQQQEPALCPAESELLLLPTASTALTVQTQAHTYPTCLGNGLPTTSPAPAHLRLNFALPCWAPTFHRQVAPLLPVGGVDGIARHHASDTVGSI